MARDGWARCGRRRRRAAAAAAAAAAACAGASRAATRARAGNAAFDLPDEVVAHIASIAIHDAMATAASVQAATATLMAVSRQLRAATRGAMDELQTRVRAACASLLGPSPLPPARVQATLTASRLTLRGALALSGPWYEYVRARRVVERMRADPDCWPSTTAA